MKTQDYDSVRSVRLRKKGKSNHRRLATETLVAEEGQEPQAGEPRPNLASPRDTLGKTARLQFRPGSIEGVIWKPVIRYRDQRGWLCELFRQDEMATEFHPVMAYLSMTDVGVARGPHEHVHQTDCFCFQGPSSFKVYLWDRRPDSPTYLNCQTEIVGADRPMLLIVAAGVVHAYRNVGSEPGLVFNCPNRLYKGPGRKEPVDEIRHEERVDSPYRLN